ncbi:MAG: alpha/beta hydrolase [Bacteroidota bacterium]|nr:alpha/beta hydrolase [Bacteroidota bacterium]
MQKTIKYKDSLISFSDAGSGKAIVFLHGYLESSEIWNDFARKFTLNNRVVCIDLPGHGNSSISKNTASLELMAEIVNEVLKYLCIEKCFMIGHSMGGYATLAFLEFFPKKLFAFCLFHSHPYCDSYEVIKKRLREITLVEKGRKDSIAAISIPNSFANINRNSFADSIEKAISIACNTSENGIIACLNGMIERKDRSELLEKTSVPNIIIAGKLDNYISYNKVIKNMNLSENSQLTILSNSGHMGFIEEAKLSGEILQKFIKHISNEKF